MSTFACWAHHATLNPKLFTNEAAYDAAIRSGWADSPVKFAKVTAPAAPATVAETIPSAVDIISAMPIPDAVTFVPIVEDVPDVPVVAPVEDIAPVQGGKKKGRP